MCTSPLRFDYAVYTGPPDRDERCEILARRRAAAPPRAWADDVDVEALARSSDGCSGADLVALCQVVSGRSRRVQACAGAVARPDRRLPPLASVNGYDLGGARRR